MKLGIQDLQQLRNTALTTGRNHQGKGRASLARASFDLAYAADVLIALTVVGAAAEVKDGSTDRAAEAHNDQKET